MVVLITDYCKRSIYKVSTFLIFHIICISTECENLWLITSKSPNAVQRHIRNLEKHLTWSYLQMPLTIFARGSILDVWILLFSMNIEKQNRRYLYQCTFYTVVCSKICVPIIHHSLSLQIRLSCDFLKSKFFLSFPFDSVNNVRLQKIRYLSRKTEVWKTRWNL